MTYRAHVEHGALVLDTPTTLPEGARFSLRPLRPKATHPRVPARRKKEEAPPWMALVGKIPPESADEMQRFIADADFSKVNPEDWK